MTETYGPLTKSYSMPEWNTLPKAERYTKMARQGHGFLTSLPVRVIRTSEAPGIIADVKKDGAEIGEVVFEGNICTKRYYKDSNATSKLWEGGVLHSGDLAVWCEDGSVKIVDRKKDVIISGTFVTVANASADSRLKVARIFHPLLSKPLWLDIHAYSRQLSLPCPTHDGENDPKHTSHCDRARRCPAVKRL